ncbi:MAG: hypothetical protein ACOYL3_23680 [Desulfuromonadaceae bacterium]
MAVEALGRLAGASRMNFQVKAESVPQAAQDARKPVKSAQTDTVNISAQALKMADDKVASARDEAKKADEQKALQLAGEKSDAAKKSAQANRNGAMKAYAAFGPSPSP